MPTATPLAPVAPVTGRLPALDRLRAIAVVVMLVHHVTQWLSGEARHFFPGRVSFVMTDVAAPAFAVAAGASLHLLLASRRRQGWRAGRLHRLVLRRYGLLLPIGLALSWVAFGDPLTYGVLETLGVASLLAYGAAHVLPARARPAATVAVLALAAPVELWCRRWPDDSVVHGMGAGTFPVLLYTGLVLTGVVAVRYLERPDQGAATAIRAVAVLGAGAVAMAAAGHPPDRFPGGPAFVVPGLAGTAVLYAVAARWPAGPGGPLTTLLDRAGRHALGLFIAHHGVYLALRWSDLLGDFPALPSFAVALAATAAMVALAPHVPPLPWSPRRGWGKVPEAVSG